MQPHLPEAPAWIQGAEKTIETGLCVNPGKKEIVESEAGTYACHAIKTRIITKDDPLVDVVSEYAKPHLKKGDILFLSEKMVSCSQGRAFPTYLIKPGFLARFLSKYVSKSTGGVGLGLPEMMQCAINEVGGFRIFLASCASVVGRVFGQRGWFYRVAGDRVKGIDGPEEYTIPPLNTYIVLTPAEPDRAAEEVAKVLDDVLVLIVDVNDIGAQVIGSSEKIDRPFMESLLRQNPLGQNDQSTPMGILRPLEDEATQSRELELA